MLKKSNYCWSFVLIAFSAGCQLPASMKGLSVTSSRENGSMMDEAPPMRLAAGAAPALNSRWSPPEKKSNDSSQSGGLLSPKPTSESRNAIAKLKPVADESEIEAFTSLPPRERELAQRQLAAVANQRTRRAEDVPEEDESVEAEETQTIEMAGAELEIPDPRRSKTSSKTKQPLIQRVAHVEESAHAFDDDEIESDAPPLSIRTPEIPKSRPTTTGRTKPSKSIDDYSQDELFDALVTKIAAQASESEDALRREVIQRTLLVLDNRLDEAVEPIDGLEASEQQYLHQQLTALATLIDPKGPPARSKRYAEAMPYLREALSHLGAATGKLDVRTPVFCTEVESFGNVTRFEKDRFEPGQQVILYCEVDQFVAKREGDGFQTQLQGSYEVFDVSGVKVAEQTLPEDTQTCSHYRRDYFIAYRLYLPSHLEPGTYPVAVDNGGSPRKTLWPSRRAI